MDTTELARLIENLLRVGTITDVQPGTPPRVRVQAGGIDTDWLPWIEARAGKTRTWSPPTLGEQVLLLCPSGDPRNGVVLTGIPSDSVDVPSHSPDETVTLYPDGAQTTYNHATGELAVTGVKTVLVEAAEEILFKCPHSIFDGKVTVKNLFTYGNGISGTGGENGNTIAGDLTHQNGKLSSNGVVLDDHGHGAVQRGGDWTDGTR